MSAPEVSDNQRPSTERLDTFRCNLEGIVLDSATPENTSGAFGDLFTATHPTEGKLALKRPRGDLCDRKVIAAIEIEASVWTRLRHPRILRFLGVCTILDDVYLVSTYADNGSLPGFLSRRPTVDRRRLVIEIAEGLVYLHQCGIIHGDLKGNNVLISGDEHVLICDFGLAKHVTSRTATTLRGVGSLAWQSPEMLHNAEGKSFASDVYAFGITVYEVLSGKEPYSHHTGLFSLITGVVIAAERPPKDPITAPDGSSYFKFWEQAEKCWDGDPTRRPSMLAVLRHLDPSGFEGLITTQQIELEASLDLVGRRQTRIQDRLSLPFTLEGEALEPVEWARRIQLRINSLHNSRRPAARLSTEIIGRIVLMANPLPFLDFKSCFTGILSSARLRRVCKAWYRAIDTTPEISRYILININGNNIREVLDRNPESNCLLKCLIYSWPWKIEQLPWTVLGLVEPAARQISELQVVFSTDVRVRSPMFADSQISLPFPKLSKLAFFVYDGSPTQFNPFRTSNLHLPESPQTLSLDRVSFEVFKTLSLRRVRVLTMVNAAVTISFVQRLCTFLHVASQISEVNLRSLEIDRSCEQEGWMESEWYHHTLRSNHRALQRVSLAELAAPLPANIMHSLESYQCNFIEVDNLDPEHLTDPTTPCSAIVRRLALLPPDSHISLRHGLPTTSIHWSTPEMSEVVATESSEGTCLWQSGRMEFHVSSGGRLALLIQSLSALGLQRLVDDFRRVKYLDPDNPLIQSNLQIMVLGPESLEWALGELCSTTYDDLGSIRYPWPCLEELIVTQPSSGPQQQGWDAVEYKFYHAVVWRQTVARLDAGKISRFRRLGVPTVWMHVVKQIQQLSPDFSDIEVYAADTNVI